MDQCTVLVVEDDSAIRELIAELLRDAGYAVLEASCGREALHLASGHALSVVLVDHRLPDMSGPDVLKRLRTHPALRYVPAMLVSGLAHQIEDSDHGADRILSKPFDIMDLLELVHALANVRQGSVA